jgi:hypothetical protein
MKWAERLWDLPYGFAALWLLSVNQGSCVECVAKPDERMSVSAETRKWGLAVEEMLAQGDVMTPYNTIMYLPLESSRN